MSDIEKPKLGRPKKQPAEVLESVKDNFVNKHNAIVEQRLTYDRNVARPGHVWFVWYVRYKKRWIDKKSKIFIGNHRHQEGLEILKTFVEEHGVENVKRMIIQNIINDKQFK